MRRRTAVGLAAAVACASAVFSAGGAAMAAPGPDTRLSNDAPGTGGYVSNYTMVTGVPYTDPVLTACSQSRGRQNEPAVAVDPRNPKVVVGSSNDYCGVFQANGALLGVARLLPLRERRPVVHQFAGARLPRRHVAVRGERPGPHVRLRGPGARVGPFRAPVRRVGELR